MSFAELGIARGANIPEHGRLRGLEVGNPHPQYSLAGHDHDDGTGTQVDAVSTSESTTSTTFTDLATSGPAVAFTVPSSGAVRVVLTAQITGSNGLMSVEASGLSASDDRALFVTGQASRILTLTGLTPGSLTFTAKYRSTDGVSVSFLRREISVEGVA